MRRLLHAEWTKLRTTAEPAALLAGVVISTLTVAILSTATTQRAPRPGADPVHLGLTGVVLGQAAVACLAVLTVGGEYATGIMSTTLTASPRRLMVLAGKAVVTAVVTAAAGGLAVAGSLVAARLILPGRGFDPAHGMRLVSPGDAPTFRAAVGTVLYLVLVAWLSLGIAAVVRDLTAAIGVVVGLLYLFPLLSALVSNPTWHRNLERIGPTSAGQSIEATVGLSSLPIGPWAGLAVLAAWSAGSLVLGGLALRWRDA